MLEVIEMDFGARMKYTSVNPIGSGGSTLVSGAFSGEVRRVLGIDLVAASGEGSVGGPNRIFLMKAASGQTSGPVIYSTFIQQPTVSASPVVVPVRLTEKDLPVQLDAGASLTARAVASGQVIANTRFWIDV